MIDLAKRGAALAAAVVLAACGSGGGTEGKSGGVETQAEAAFSCDGYPQPDTGSPGGITVCELRSYPGLPGGHASIDTERGDVHVYGRGGGTVDLDAYVYATGLTEERARALAAQVEIHLENGHYYATGPEDDISPIPGVSLNVLGAETWRVSFEAAVPATMDLGAGSTSGDVTVEGVGGNIGIASTSGDATARALAGTVNVATTSGDVTVDLYGRGWSGSGLFAGSTSGNVTFLVPGDYSANFELDSTSGSITSDFGGTASDEPGHSHLSERVGGGGTTLQGSTTSGDIALTRK